MKKIKIKIVSDELYPYYLIKDVNHYCGSEYELSSNLIELYNSAEETFMKARKRLQKAMEKIDVKSV